MEWIPVAKFQRDLDMSAVDERLHQAGVIHRFTMEKKGQVLWLDEAADVPGILSQIDDWLVANKNGAELTWVSHDASTKGGSSLIFELSEKPAPATLFLLALSFIGFGLHEFGEQFIEIFTFWDRDRLPTLEGNNFKDVLSGEYWRLITPIFLHFSIIHIVFNALWVWFFGTMIERRLGAFVFLAIVAVVGVISNVCQAIVNEPWVGFGGLSGVLYGLLAFAWGSNKWLGRKFYPISHPLFAVMTILMLLSPFGLFDMMASGGVADTAHISGYITGIILSPLSLFTGDDSTKKNSDEI